MERWRGRVLHILELTAVAVLLLFVVEVVVGALRLVTSNASDEILNLDIMVAIVLWAGRISVFTYLGRRAQGRAGQWWPAAPAALLAVLVVSLATGPAAALVRSLQAGRGVGDALAALRPGQVSPDWLAVLLVGGVLGTIMAAVGPSLKAVKSADRSVPMTALGGLVVVGAFGLLGAGAVTDVADRRAASEGARRVADLRTASRAGGEVAAMRGVLEQVRDGQARERQRAPEYAGRAADLGIDVPADLDLRIVEAGRDGWLAVITGGDADRGCALWHGRIGAAATTPGGRPVPADHITCDP